MHLQCPDGRDDHGTGRLQPRLSAFYVEELLAAEIGAEARLRHHDIGEAEPEPGRDHRVAAMGDIGEGSAMHESGRTLERLDEVRRQRIPQQGRHGAVGLEVARGHGALIPALGDDDPAQPLPQIVEVAGEAEDRHDLGGDRDVEPVLARGAIGDPAQTIDDGAERAVVHVERPAPPDAPRVDAERIVPEEVVVQHRCQQVVGRGDGVEVAGEMQVDLVHRRHLRAAAARRAALDAETGAEARLPQADHGFRAETVQGIAEADGRGRLALGRPGSG